MSSNATLADQEKLRAFEERMACEGAAGFADGPTPWEDWNDALPLARRKGQKDEVPQLHRRQPQRPAGQRALTGIAQLAMLALGVGIAGVYFTSGTEPQLADNGIQPAPFTVNPPLAVLDAQQDSLRFEPDTLPAPAAGQPDIAVAAITNGTPGVPETVQTTAGVGDGPADMAVPGVMNNETPETPVQAAATELVAAAQQPAAVAATESSATAIQRIETPTAPATREATGRWVVNLASYNRESTAQRMLDEFSDKGVTAELVKVTVNDKPMIRIRTTGYGSLREANDWAALLEERLELNGAWVSKR
jgi:cell division septation protein DedD